MLSTTLHLRKDNFMPTNSEMMDENTDPSMEEKEEVDQVTEQPTKTKRSLKETLDLVVSIILVSLLFISVQYFLSAAKTAFYKFEDVGIEYIVHITQFGVYMVYYRYLDTKIKSFLLRMIIFFISGLILAVFAVYLFEMRMTYTFV